jgi:23S rRNA pseudouridine1911/1915/1917 synthase
LVNALLYHCGNSLSGVGGVRRPGIVHRIDKDTSGLLVVAKHDMAHAGLAEQLQRHAVSRVYEAICVGNVKEDTGTVTFGIGRHGTDRKKMAAYRTTDGNGRVRDAVTHYQVVERYPLGTRYGQSFTHVRCELETGRTHQIRVHMAALGHPLLGDAVYGGGGTKFERAHAALIQGQCLHAGKLRLTHPVTGKDMRFECPLPDEFAKLKEVLRREAGM